MNSYILYPVLGLRGFIIFFVAVLVLFTFIALFLMGRKKKGLRNFGWQGLFLGLTNREFIFISLGISQICLIFSLVIFPTSMGAVQITAILLLCFLRAVLGFSVSGAVNEVIYAVLSVAALMAAGLLRDYMRETGVEVYIGTVWVLLSVFILQYSLYYFIKSLERTLRRHELGIRNRRNDGEGRE